MSLPLDGEMINAKYKNSIYVIEGFIILTLSKILFTVLTAEIKIFFMPSVPDVTMIMVASVVAYTTTIFYLNIRTRYLPIYAVSKKTFIYSASAFIVIWMYHNIVTIFYIVSGSPTTKLPDYQGTYKYMNMICTIALAPITEETVYRGFFVRLLIPNGTIGALLVSSVLFASSHLISSYTTLLNGFYFFVFSMIAGFVYTRAGLVAAILFHALNNICIVILTT